MPELDPQSVAYMELLALDPLVVENDLAAGQHAVDVGQHQLDCFTALFQFHAQSLGGACWPYDELFAGGSGYLAIKGALASRLAGSSAPPTPASGNRPTTSVTSISPC